MKPTTVLLGAVSMLAASTLSLPAQTISLVYIGKQANYVQATDSAASLKSGLDAYKFTVGIKGSQMTINSPISSANFTRPGGSSTEINFDNIAADWGYGMHFTDQAGLDAAFVNGTYALDIGGTPVSLDLAGGFPTTPLATLLGASNSISGGVLPQGVNQDLTISTIFSEYQSYISSSSLPTGVAGYRIGLSINGPGVSVDLESWSTDTSPVAQFSYLIAAGSLVTGQTYNVEMEFNILTDIDNTTLSPASAFTNYTTNTTFQIVGQAVPEPSSYAAILGVLALGGVAWSRRRRV